ncbi:MAG TPA: hypothetical protein VIX42_10835 [Edaphobacter sp.]
MKPEYFGFHSTRTEEVFGITTDTFDTGQIPVGKLYPGADYQM